MIWCYSGSGLITFQHVSDTLVGPDTAFHTHHDENVVHQCDVVVVVGCPCLVVEA